MSWISAKGILINTDLVRTVEQQGDETVLTFSEAHTVKIESDIALLVWRYFDQMAETEFRFNPRIDDFERTDR